MPVAIGSKPESDFRNPIGMLSDCHRRIEQFLGGLIAITEASHNGAILEEHRPQFEIALRYFREAAPKHTLDEEESLFPRMSSHKTHDMKAVLAVLEHLQSDHLKAADRHRIVDELGNAWLAAGSLSQDDSELLLTNLAKLRSDYEEHIAVEENEIFPLSARLLTVEELNIIGKEMAARRGLRSSQ